ncbi:hypothetical protein N7517_006208 [Penicillium concentricum]|uniref:Uncharacterized protein n=1 Tax=Penicillium concentricum TaxID=293559 RepID=A0A9W9V9X2_9EURO|nr:uncharacterized protein N7517_006208 [Penicillium concentricum]KAJ5374202.1 hypothetical protein N7517_006208 [Penicillium concentricum]
MKPHFLLGSLDAKTGLLDEGPTPRSSRRESSRRCNTIYIPSDDSITPTVFMGLYSSPKRQIKDASPHISGNNEANSFKSQLARRQPQKPLARSTWRAPLQQSLKVLQAGATTVDVPGTGGGKENIPPGISANTNNKSKMENHAPMSKIARPVVQNTTPRTRIITKPKEVRKEPLMRVAPGKAQGNVVRVPKKIEFSSSLDNAWASALMRAFSAIVIQRAWRSSKERRNKHACDIATVRVEAAYEVITRWWRGVKACKLQEQTEQVKLKERTEQTLRRKPAGPRSSVRQSHQNSGRRGIRRL